jgi:hypothetical protein
MVYKIKLLSSIDHNNNIRSSICYFVFSSLKEVMLTRHLLVLGLNILMRSAVRYKSEPYPIMFSLSMCRSLFCF